MVNVPKYKHSEKFHGPYIVKEKLSDHNYIIDINGKDTIVNISKMKPYKVNKYSQLPRKPGTRQNYKNVTESAKKPADQVISSSKQKFVPDSDSSDTDTDILSGLAAMYNKIANGHKTGKNKGRNSLQVDEN